ncbi:Wzz/FepE/Etk N-terminal domain-containing protein [uncultured Roseobacter sp.]|uniref:GumC family protein n=1 Tax=uncultured Roseobacter sp. TaxID=114847 RepID=UPI002631B1C8|nr:Wzz/FepE/Etk N-terminal domain-containing protein [uncultured Roseobacter sp.]
MNIDLWFYFKLLIRRLPVMTALFLICAGIGAAVAMRLPDVYSASARLLVESPQIPDSMASSTIQAGAREQLSVIQQQLLTRANLIDIANEFSVFPNIRQMRPDDVVAGMRSATRIRRTGGRDQALLMSITFENENPRVAAAVVNEYVTLILDASARFRLDRTQGTLDFFEQEVERLGIELDAQSAKIVSFKNQNKNALPDDLGYRQNRQSLLQERLSRLEREFSSLSERRQQMTTLFETTGRIDNGANQSSEVQQLNRLRRDLDQALAVYSETHPRVRLLQSRIGQLESVVAGQLSGGDAGGASILDINLAEIDARMADLSRSISETSGELERLRLSIEATPSNSIALGALNRDYQNIQSLYNAAVRNLSEAQMGERIEVTSKGQRVSVLEGANVPNRPSGPNRTKLIAAGVGAGLGLAVGFFVLLELLNRSIRRPAEIVSRFGVTPLATIPFMESQTHRWVRRGALITAFVAVLVGVPLALWIIDSQYMPLELLASKIVGKLGFS